MSNDLEEGSVEAFSKKGFTSGFCSSNEAVQLLQKVIAETIGTYMVIFSGCGAVVVNKMYGEVTFPGICVVWGLIVMVMVYSVPLYIAAQVIGSLLASGTLSLLYGVPDEAFYGTIPVGPHIRSFVLEIIITFLLMFVISGVATDNRAIGELAGIAVGMTIMLNVFVAGPISGASMNPARSLGPAIVMHKYSGIWVYMAGPLIGAILGAFAYNLIRFTDKPLRELTKSSSFIKSFRAAT
ncbi:Aquaporin NIP1-1 [Euphorbia peplus]|nr:Aquaporin NIP1-1 [Euphorbia peplus]